MPAEVNTISLKTSSFSFGVLGATPNEFYRLETVFIQMVCSLSLCRLVGLPRRLSLYLSISFAPIPDLPDRKTICIMERGNEKCQPKNENTQRRRVTMRPSRRGQCGWSPSRGGPAGRWPRNSASASTRCAAG